MPMNVPAYYAPYNWTGFYFGINGGELLPNLGPACWLFSRAFDHGGPCATDRSMSSIGVLLPIAL